MFGGHSQRVLMVPAARFKSTRRTVPPPYFEGIRNMFWRYPQQVLDLPAAGLKATRSMFCEYPERVWRVLAAHFGDALSVFFCKVKTCRNII